jgi:hypothetical protein
MDDDAIRTLVTRLARSHGSGGKVIERAAILAAGADFAAVISWIAAHDGQPEAPAQATAGRGLHSARLNESAQPDAARPSRYVLPAGVLA